MLTDTVATDAAILIVDDQRDLVESIGIALESAGYHVLSAGDGLTALDLMEREHVDLILADIAMPRMNGYQFYERVRENARWTAIPFLFLTARTMDSDVRYGKELGVDDYLTKPIQPEDLLASVNGKLRRARQLAGIVRPVEAPDVDDAFVQVGRLKIEKGQHRVWMNAELIKLSAKEFALLEYLGRSSGKVVSAQERAHVSEPAGSAARNQANKKGSSRLPSSPATPSGAGVLRKADRLRAGLRGRSRAAPPGTHSPGQSTGRAMLP